MNNYTKIPNEILNNSNLSVSVRYLFCVLLRYCGNKEWCYPSQETLGEVLKYTPRHIRNLIKELEKAGLLLKKRTGFNKTNSYLLTKSLVIDRQLNSFQLGSKFPLHGGNNVPPKSTYIKGTVNNKGLKKLKETAYKLGIKNQP